MIHRLFICQNTTKIHPQTVGSRVSTGNILSTESLSPHLSSKEFELSWNILCNWKSSCWTEVTAHICIFNSQVKLFYNWVPDWLRWNPSWNREAHLPPIIIGIKIDPFDLCLFELWPKGRNEQETIFMIEVKSWPVWRLLNLEALLAFSLVSHSSGSGTRSSVWHLWLGAPRMNKRRTKYKNLGQKTINLTFVMTLKVDCIELSDKVVFLLTNFVS